MKIEETIFLTKRALKRKISIVIRKADKTMERIKTLETRDLKASMNNGGCGECQTSSQSACKTSCGVANQKCEKDQ